MKNMGDMGNIFKQAQKMQKDIAKIQGQLKEMIVEGAAGGGMVKVQANGASEVVSVKINPEAIDPNDVDILEDLVIVAVNTALKKAEELREKETAKVTGGLNLPGMM